VGLPARLELDYRVRFDEAGADGHLRASGFLRWAQDLTWRHSESSGFDRAWYSARRLTWLIRAVQLDIVEQVAYGSDVRVSTEVVGFRRVWARRRSQFERPDTGRTCALALIDWVLLNERGRPVRVPAEIESRFPAPSTVYTPLRVELRPPPADAAQRRFAPRASEVDPMGHVNNAAYLDYVDEQLTIAGRRADARRVPRRYRAEFLLPTDASTELVGHGWADGADWSYLLADDDGRPMFRARLEVDAADWVGG
jgi:acyl-CoA thioesterase FadM